MFKNRKKYEKKQEVSATSWSIFSVRFSQHS